MFFYIRGIPCSVLVGSVFSGFNGSESQTFILAFCKLVPRGIQINQKRKRNKRLPFPFSSVRIDGTQSVGPLLVYKDNNWGYVCDYEFDDVDAQVACRQLGYLVRALHQRHSSCVPLIPGTIHLFWKRTIW